MKKLINKLFVANKIMIIVTLVYILVSEIGPLALYLKKLERTFGVVFICFQEFDIVLAISTVVILLREIFINKEIRNDENYKRKIIVTMVLAIILFSLIGVKRAITG